MKKNLLFFLFVTISIYFFLSKDISAVSTDYNDTNYTFEQKAIVETAYAYYEKSKLNYILYGGISNIALQSNLLKEEEKGELAVFDYDVSPEHATRINTLHFVCSTFATNVYDDVFNYKILGGGIKSQANFLINVEDESSVYFVNENENKNDKKEKIKNILQPGDLIVTISQDSDSLGHVMIYVGNDTILHSNGLSYNYSNKDTFSPIRELSAIQEVGFDEWWEQFIVNQRKIRIVRPLNIINLEKVTSKAKMRVEHPGLIIEKFAKVGDKNLEKHHNVYEGQVITFVIKITNTSNQDYSLIIKDKIPSNTTYVKNSIYVQNSDNNVNINDDIIHEKITIEKGKYYAISYRVKVKENTNGMEISSYSDIDGDGHNDNTYVGSVKNPEYKIDIPDVKFYVSEVMDDNRISSLRNSCDNIDQNIDSYDFNSDYDLISEIYKDALNIKINKIDLNNLFNYQYINSTVGKLHFLRFKENNNNVEEFKKNYVPGFYGGRTLITLESEKITKDTKLEYLMPGDIIYYLSSAEPSNDGKEIKPVEEHYMLYLDGKFISYENGLKVETADYEKHMHHLRGESLYIVLRPVQTLANKNTQDSNNNQSNIPPNQNDEDLNNNQNGEDLNNNQNDITSDENTDIVNPNTGTKSPLLILLSIFLVSILCMVLIKKYRKGKLMLR